MLTSNNFANCLVLRISAYDVAFTSIASSTTMMSFTLKNYYISILVQNKIGSRIHSSISTYHDSAKAILGM